MAPRRPASSTLVRLLEAAGYRVDGRGDAVVAVRLRDHRAVVIAPVSRSPADLEAHLPSGAVHRTILYDEEPGSTAREAAGERGIEVLSPSTLGPALGELLLPPPGGPWAGVPAEETPTVPDLPFSLVRDGEQTVRPRIGRYEAEALSGLDHPNYTLRLVPYYVAVYRVRPASATGGRGALAQRLVAVNAANRRVEFWDEGDRELVSSVSEPHQTLAPQFGENVAAPLAVEAVRRQHAVRVDHTEQHGGALVIETRRVLPELDDVRIGRFVLLYVPHWYAEGTEGRVVIDAVTGRRDA